jgi:two-component system, chemotaxis family, sensor kinase CheA
VVEGESTELDKSILDSIGDPLVHLVRNAVDHGLEAADLRRQHGKNAQGRVTLRAANVGGSVVIEVEDDGRGLDVEALKRKAVGKGLVSAAEAASMSHADACRLVFLPGLSTADKVTDVSGRGVGMDVVASNVRSLHGTVDIRSTPGTGTVFTIKLPTSLIISKGILLEAGGEEYILPLASIRDMLKIPAAEVHQYGGRKLVQARGQVHGLYSLAELLGFTPRPAEEVPIAIIDTGKQRYGLIADRFVSEVEVLVKPLSGVLGAREEFHGAAIMGDGRVVLVLNPAECCRAHVVEAA